MMRLSLLVLTVLTAAQSLHAASFYTVRLDDPKAVTLEPGAFLVKADGVADDSDALQQAINKVQETTRRGIVFIPEGRYRLGKTVYVWSGIRLIGWGKNRPVFVLGEKTPGFQEGEGKYMIYFTSDRPAQGQPPRDANPGTFYSAMSNIDIEIGDGNPAAVGVRSHWAQHCYLAHMDFRTGGGRAGIQQIGNEIDDCRFFGGEFGITTTKPSPSWPFLMIDSSFEGQRQAAIDTEEGGMTLVRNTFRKVPTAVQVHADRHEELWMKDCRLEDISGPAVVISHETSALMQANMRNVVCVRVPILVAFRESGKKVEGPGPDASYVVEEFCHGNQITDLGATPEIKTTLQLGKTGQRPAFAPPENARANDKAAVPPAPSDIPALPACDTWVNLKTLGAKGDITTDDTAALKEAIAKHRTIYLPTGRYRITDTLVLKPDTVLIGLNPATTQIVLADFTPAFHGDGGPKAMIEAPKGGTCILTGIGVDTGANLRAVGVKWMAGKDSMVSDVKFLQGHGTYAPNGGGIAIYNAARTGDPDPRKRWNSQYWSLWITDGGGGTFKDIWTANQFAQAGIYVSDTDTEGRLYATSIEHHVANEVILRNVANWQVYALQTEEERGEGPRALPLEIDRCHNITFANIYNYRVDMPRPFPYGIKVRESHDLEFCGLHVYSPGKYSFDATLFDETTGQEVRTREVARLLLSGLPPKVKAAKESAVLAAGAKVEKVMGGFQNADGAVADAAGNVYFLDAPRGRIYRWSPEKSDLALIRGTPAQMQAIALDKAGNLLIVSRGASGGGGGRGGAGGLMVQALAPGGGADALKTLPLVEGAPKAGLTAILPISRWRDAHDFLRVTTAPTTSHFLAPDAATFIPATGDLLRAYSLAPATPDHPFYVADEFGQRVVGFTVAPDGSLSKPKVLAEEGEAGVAVDEQGNVYVAAGQVFVYDPSGKLIDTIEVPERPTSLVFGGKDRRTLFITARTSLYAVAVKFKGQ